MAARRKQKQAGNSYNLQNQVEILIKIQAEDDGTFLDEFSSQPSAGQVLSGLQSSDTDTSSTDWGMAFQKSIDGSDFSDPQTKVKRFKARSSERISHSRKEFDMSDQTFINDRILSQLDAINKRLDAIENPSVSASVVSYMQPLGARNGLLKLLIQISNKIRMFCRILNLKNRQSQVCKCSETYHWLSTFCYLSKMQEISRSN